MRLIGQAKAGFYPTPLSVTEDIVRLLNIKGAAKLLDASCGEGEALYNVQSAFPCCKTYGVELDAGRYAISKKRLDVCLNCDSMTEFQATNGAFDILWENPPYDYDVKEENSKTLRTEKKFLQAHTKYLKPKGGVLIYIIPFSSLKYVKSILEKYHELRVLAFPEMEYQQFKQVVVIGKTSNYTSPDIFSRNRAYLKDIIENTPEERAYEYLVTTSECDAVYDVVSSDVELKTFSTTRINPDEACSLLDNSPVSKFFESLIEVKSINSIRPLSDLTEGHLAMLIASGMIDGLLENNGERLVIKGLVAEGFRTREEVEEGKIRHIMDKHYNITVNVLNLTTEKMIRVVA